jgi:diacylglycerol kinase (ATP)
MVVSSTHTSLPVGLISNANSGRNRKQLTDVEALLSKHPHVHHVVTHRAEEVEAALKNFASKGLSVVAINGGDGTLSQLLTGLLARQDFNPLPLVVMIPGGTANMHVEDIGRQGKLLTLLKQLCSLTEQSLQQLEQVTRPIMRIQVSPAQQAFYGMFFGTGIIMHGIEYTHANIHSRGINESGPVLGMIRTLWGLLRKDPRFCRPFNIGLQIDQQTQREPRDISLMVVSSLERLFLGLHPYWGENDGTFHFTVIHDGATKILRTLPGLLKGRKGKYATEEDGYQSLKIEQLSLTFDGSFTVDGELYAASINDGPVKISHGGDITFLKLPL